jgi:molybdate transport repressor ModE-like protein
MLAVPDSLPDLVSLRLFCAVVRLGSISAAAAEEGMSQPSASHRLVRLERRLGLTLLERGPGGSGATESGHLVAAWAEDLLAAAARLLGSVAALSAGEGGHLRVAASYTIAEYLLPHWLAKLARLEPGVSIQLEVMNSGRVMTALAAGEADLGFIESLDKASRLDERIITTDELVVVVSPSHPWARARSPLTPQRLAATRHVLRERGSGTRDVYEHALRVTGHELCAPALELGSTAAVKYAVSSGVGPTALSRLTVTDELNDGRLALVGVTGLDLQRPLRAVWRRGEPLPLAGRMLVAQATQLSSDR